MIPELDRVYRSRWEALLAVDEMVASVAQALERKGVLDDTYLIFTSDNGYHIGECSAKILVETHGWVSSSKKRLATNRAIS